MPFVHPTAVIDAGAELCQDVAVWHFSHVCTDAVIGEKSKIGQNCYIDRGVKIGRNVKIQNNVSVYRGVIVEDHVFLGPSCVLTNVITPRSAFPRNNPDADYKATAIREGASVGANATLRCGIELGAWCMVGSGAVVTRDVRPHEIVVGVPAKFYAWACMCGEILVETEQEGQRVCPSDTCGRDYHLQEGRLVLTHTPPGAVSPVKLDHAA